MNCASGEGISKEDSVSRLRNPLFKLLRGTLLKQEPLGQHSTQKRSAVPESACPKKTARRLESPGWWFCKTCWDPEKSLAITRKRAATHVGCLTCHWIPPCLFGFEGKMVGLEALKLKSSTWKRFNIQNDSHRWDHWRWPSILRKSRESTGLWAVQRREYLEENSDARSARVKVWPSAPKR